MIISGVMRSSPERMQPVAAPLRPTAALVAFTVRLRCYPVATQRTLAVPCPPTAAPKPRPPPSYAVTFSTTACTIPSRKSMRAAPSVPRSRVQVTPPAQRQPRHLDQTPRSRRLDTPPHRITATPTPSAIAHRPHHDGTACTQRRQMQPARATPWSAWHFRTAPLPRRTLQHGARSRWPQGAQGSRQHASRRHAQHGQLKARKQRASVWTARSRAARRQLGGRSARRNRHGSRTARQRAQSGRFGSALAIRSCAEAATRREVAAHGIGQHTCASICTGFPGKCLLVTSVFNDLRLFATAWLAVSTRRFWQAHVRLVIATALA